LVEKKNERRQVEYSTKPFVFVAERCGFGVALLGGQLRALHRFAREVVKHARLELPTRVALFRGLFEILNAVSTFRSTPTPFS